jgi:NYN domain
MKSEGQTSPSIEASWGRTGIFLDVPNWETGLRELHASQGPANPATRVEHGPSSLLTRSLRGIRALVSSHGRIVVARAYGRCYVGNGSESVARGPTFGLVVADREGFASCARFVTNGDGGKAEDVDMPLYRDVADAVYRDQLDTVVVVSGDGDMSYVAETVQGCGKRFVMMSWMRSASQRLARVADDMLALPESIVGFSSSQGAPEGGNT